MFRSRRGSNGIWDFTRNNPSRESTPAKTALTSSGQLKDVEGSKAAIWDFGSGGNQLGDKQGKDAIDNLLQSDKRSVTHSHEIRSYRKPLSSRRRSIPVLSKREMLNKRLRNRSLPSGIQEIARRKVSTLSITPSKKASRASAVCSRYGDSEGRSGRSCSKQSIGSFFGANDHDIDITRHSEDSPFSLHYTERLTSEHSHADISEHGMDLELPPEMGDIAEDTYRDNRDLAPGEHAPEDPFKTSDVLPKPQSYSSMSIDSIVKDKSMNARRKHRQSMPAYFNSGNQRQNGQRRYSLPATGQQQSNGDIFESQFILEKDDYTMSKTAYPCEFPDQMADDPLPALPELQAVKRAKRKSLYTIADMPVDDVAGSYNLVQKASEKWAESSVKNKYLDSFITPEDTSFELSSSTNELSGKQDGV